MARARRYHKVRDRPRTGDRVRRPWSGHVGTVRGYQSRSGGYAVAVNWDDGEPTTEAMSQLVPVELVDTERKPDGTHP